VDAEAHRGEALLLLGQLVDETQREPDRVIGTLAAQHQAVAERLDLFGAMALQQCPHSLLEDQHHL